MCVCVCVFSCSIPLGGCIIISNLSVPWVLVTQKRKVTKVRLDMQVVHCRYNSLCHLKIKRSNQNHRMYHKWLLHGDIVFINGGNVVPTYWDLIQLEDQHMVYQTLPQQWTSMNSHKNIRLGEHWASVCNSHATQYNLLKLSHIQVKRT